MLDTYLKLAQTIPFDLFKIPGVFSLPTYPSDTCWWYGLIFFGFLTILLVLLKLLYFMAILILY
jgi:hypothetical protein